MNAKNFINDICKEIKYKPTQKYISEEIEGHIQDLKTEYSVKGYSENDAEEKAVEQMGNPTQIGKRLNKIHRPKLDWKLLILIFILIGFRITLYIENYFECKGVYFSILEIEKDINYTLVGLCLGLVIYFFDYGKIKKYTNLIYLTSTGILIFQWINWYYSLDIKIIGNILNTRLWNVSILLYIIAFAGYMAEYNKRDFLNIFILYTISCILIYVQSGSITNTTILILAYLIIIASYMIKNNPNSIKKIITICGGTLCLSIILMILMTNIKGTLFAEKFYYLDEYNFSQKYEEKVLKNLKLIGTADEMETISNLNTSQYKFLYLLGTLGVLPTIGLVFAILVTSIRLVNNSKNIKDAYGKYLVIGLGSTYIVQSVIHILMNLNLWIRSDVNLPFVAEGNLYFLINCFTFAIILSVYRRKDISFENHKSYKTEFLRVYRKVRKFENWGCKHIVKRNLLKDA